MSNLRIVPATEPDIPVILDLIHALAAYEKLAHVVTATPEGLRETLFGIKPAAEVLFGALGSRMRRLCGFLRDLFDVSSSARTLFGRPVRETSPARQGNRVGAAEALGENCDRTRLRQVGVGSARLEPA